MGRPFALVVEAPAAKCQRPITFAPEVVVWQGNRKSLVTEASAPKPQRPFTFAPEVVDWQGNRKWGAREERPAPTDVLFPEPTTKQRRTNDERQSPARDASVQENG